MKPQETIGDFRVAFLTMQPSDSNDPLQPET